MKVDTRNERHHLCILMLHILHWYVRICPHTIYTHSHTLLNLLSLPHPLSLSLSLSLLFTPSPPLSPSSLSPSLLLPPSLLLSPLSLSLPPPLSPYLCALTYNIHTPSIPPPPSTVTHSFDHYTLCTHTNTLHPSFQIRLTVHKACYYSTVIVVLITRDTWLIHSLTHSLIHTITTLYIQKWTL